MKIQKLASLFEKTENPIIIFCAKKDIDGFISDVNEFSVSCVTAKFDKNSKHKYLGLQTILYDGKYFLFVPEENKIEFLKKFI